MKKAVTVLLALVSFAVFSTGICAAPVLPATGVTAPLMPLFIGLMVVAVAAIVVCLILLKKKK